MGLIWITEDPRQQSRTQDGGKFDAYRYFTAQFSSLKDNNEAILFQRRPDLAPYGVHPRRVDALVVDCQMEFERGTSPPIWRIQVQYSTQYEQFLDPLAAPAIITTSGASRDEVALVDGEGNPILNTAGDPINDPCPVRRRTDLVYHVKKNVAAGALPGWALQCVDCVNSDSVTILGAPREPETLMFQFSGTGDEQTVNNKKFYEANFDLAYRADTWREAIPNRGFYQLVNPKQTMVQAQPGSQLIGKGKNALLRMRIMVREGTGGAGNGVLVPCTEAQMLDKNGKYIEKPTLQNIVILTPLIPSKVPFSVLPLK